MAEMAASVDLVVLKAAEEKRLVLIMGPPTAKPYSAAQFRALPAFVIANHRGVIIVLRLK